LAKKRKTEGLCDWEFREVNKDVLSEPHTSRHERKRRTLHKDTDTVSKKKKKNKGAVSFSL
jgi:hypothetical protein